MCTPVTLQHLTVLKRTHSFTLNRPHFPWPIFVPWCSILGLSPLCRSPILPVLPSPCESRIDRRCGPWELLFPFEGGNKQRWWEVLPGPGPWVHLVAVALNRHRDMGGHQRGLPAATNLLSLQGEGFGEQHPQTFP